MREASIKYSMVRNRSGLGARDFPNAMLADPSGKIFAYISYNGIVWPGRSRKPNQTPLYEPTLRELQANRCWRGYQPVPGKKAYSKGSCRKIRRNPRPPQAVRRTACGALRDRRRYGRGGTAVGVARARDLCRGANVSDKTLQRMRSYFLRHRASKNENAKRLSDRSSAASIADRLWGGSAGMRWAGAFD